MVEDTDTVVTPATTEELLENAAKEAAASKPARTRKPAAKK